MELFAKVYHICKSDYLCCKTTPIHVQFLAHKFCSELDVNFMHLCF